VGEREAIFSLQVCEAEGRPSDASFEIKFINVKYMQMGSDALEMGIMQQERHLPAATEHGKQNKKYK
jgi:hypothetical protein